MNVTPFDREPLPMGRLLRAYAMEVKFETMGALRDTGFALPFVVIPVALYLLVGVMINGQAEQSGRLAQGFANYLFAACASMGVMMPGIFSGVILAQERCANLLKLKRALPLPPGATIVAKVLMSMAVASVAVTLVAVAALAAGKLTISPAQVLVVWAVLIVGTIPFSAIGLLIGALASGSAAPAWGNLLFLPMMLLSGLFIPLPEFLKTWVLVWPAFHLNQLALGLAGVEQFTYIPPALAAGVLCGVSVLCGGLAVRRLARVG